MRGTNLASRMCSVLVSKFLLPIPMSFEYFDSSAALTFIESQTSTSRYWRPGQIKMPFRCWKWHWLTSRIPPNREGRFAVRFFTLRYVGTSVPCLRYSTSSFPSTMRCSRWTGSRSSSLQKSHSYAQWQNYAQHICKQHEAVRVWKSWPSEDLRTSGFDWQRRSITRIRNLFLRSTTAAT